MESVALCVFVLGYLVVAAVVVVPLASIVATKLPTLWRGPTFPRWLAEHRTRLFILVIIGMLLACLGLLLLNPQV